jgi:hypothetical protein
MKSNYAHKDIIGNDIQLDATVICTHNNRIVLGTVIKINPGSTRITVLPLPTDTGGRRNPPPQKKLVREEYNVFVVNDGEFMIGTLKGYTLKDTDDYDDEE